MGSLLNNDNKTNYLFKKDNLRAQTALEDPAVSTSGRTLRQEPYLANKIVINDNIFANDICFNLPDTATVLALDNDNNIPDSTWGNNSTDTAFEQNLSYYDLSHVDESLSNLRFYKKVYLEAITSDEKQFWWFQYPSRDTDNLGKISNNLLSNTIPNALGSVGSYYLPRVHLWNGTTWQSETFNSGDTNWTMDYATGILTFNVTNSTLSSGNGSNLNAADNKKTDPHVRPRISFIKYVGPLGVNGGGGSSGGGGGVSDISFNEIKDSLEDLDQAFWAHFFDIPSQLQHVSWNDEIVSGIKQIIISWNNPPQNCAAFDFYQLNIIDNSNIQHTDQIYYSASNGLQESDTQIYNEITRKLNKLPFHEYIRIQYKEFDSNSNVKRDWTDLTGAQISSISNLKPVNSSGVLYPFFKEINKVVIFNNSPSNPSEQTGKSTQDILPKQDGKREIILNNIFESSSKFHFRLAMDNRACIDGKSGKERTPLDISNNLNWSYIPENQLDFIELGDFGPAPPPRSIQFSGNNSPFGFDFIQGFAGPSPEPVMDTSFNTEFTPTAPLTVQYGFDLSGSPHPNRKQIGEDFISTLTTLPTNASDYYYANTNSFGFDDVSYNTGEVKVESFTADIWEPPSNNWNVSSEFITYFNYNGEPWEGLLLPEYQYDISGFFMKNSKHPQISYLEKSVYASNLPKDSDYPTLQDTASEVMSNSNHFNKLSTETFRPDDNVLKFSIDITNSVSGAQNLTTVRHGFSHDKFNVIFLNRSNIGISASQLTITFNDDFITSTQDYDPHDDVLVGSDIWNTNIGNYKIDHTFLNTSGTTTTNSSTANIRGFNFDPISNSSLPSLPESKITVQNSDPTGAVSNTATIQQARYGGYYNYQKILKNGTGVFDIDENNISDSADINTISANKIILTQNLTLPSSLISNTKTIEYYIGFASQKDIDPKPKTLDIPLITTDNYLFGIQMPSLNVTFQLSDVVIDDIYTKWIPNNKNLCYINLYYRRSSSDKYTIKTDEHDWDEPVIHQQTISFGSSNLFHVEGFNNSNNHFIKDSPDWYSRNGLEGSDNNSQFYIEIKTTNNIFSQESNDPEFTETLNSNSSGSNGFTWAAAAGVVVPSPKILWWDYTYKQGAGAISAGELPDGFVTTQSGHSSNNVSLKDPRGAATTNAGGNTYFWLGAGTIPTYEWYNNDYQHNHNQNPPSLEDNQLLWANGSFRAGDSNLTSTDKNFPYIDYQIYYNNNNSSNNYANKKDSGEGWYYTLAITESSIGEEITIDGTTDKYKFIVIEDSNPGILGPNFYNNAWTDVEVYVNGDSYSNSLTLGTDYIMYICLEGPRYNGFGNGATSFTTNSSTKYRTGWLDCQRIKSGFTTVADGAGCGNCKVNNVLTRYRFTLEGLSSAIPANGIVSKIFYRIGIKNGSQKDIKSINIKYVN